MAMFDRSRLREGMTVYSFDGEKLGRVFAVGEEEMQIEKGLFFPKDYRVRYDAISDIRGDDVVLDIDKAQLRGGGASARREGLGAAGIGYGEGSDFGRERGLREEEDETRVQVAEEELDVLTRQREAGEVRLHKTVEVQTKQVEVPLRKERVVVERVPLSAAEGTPDTAHAFQEETLRVPVREEEVEVRKRPVVREEVRVRKTGYAQEQRVAADVRKERVDVRTEGEVEGDADFRRDIEHSEEERRSGIRSPDEDLGKTRF